MDNMCTTLMPTNLLHLCDDIQEKIGKEIKCIRIKKDSKKRYDYISRHINIMYRKGESITSYRDLNHCIYNINYRLSINLKRVLKGRYGNYPDLNYLDTDFLDLNDTLQPQINEFITRSENIIKFYINGNEATSKKLIKGVIDGYDSDDSDYEDGDHWLSDDEDYSTSITDKDHWIYDNISDDSDSEDSIEEDE